jgi:hypothetical protein
LNVLQFRCCCIPLLNVVPGWICMQLISTIRLWHEHGLMQVFPCEPLYPPTSTVNEQIPERNITRLDRKYEGVIQDMKEVMNSSRRITEPRNIIKISLKYAWTSGRCAHCFEKSVMFGLQPGLTFGIAQDSLVYEKMRKACKVFS